MTQRIVPGSSKLIHAPRFAGQLDQHLQQGERLLDSTDGRIDIFDGYSTKPHNDLAIILTDLRIVAFRGRGLMGEKRPLIVNLASVDEAGVTQQGNVSVKFTGDIGQPGLWKLYIGGVESEADRWAQQIVEAAESLHAPAGSSAEPSAGEQDEADPTITQLNRFMHSLSNLTGANNIGQPFGEGLGLEDALHLLNQFVPDVESVYSAGQMMAVTILAENGRSGLGPADLQHVMGVGSLDVNGTPADRAAASLAGAAETFLGQFNQPGANMWELWKSRDDVAREFLCWHAVAWGRLATIGRVDPN